MHMGLGIDNVEYDLNNIRRALSIIANYVPIKYDDLSHELGKLTGCSLENDATGIIVKEIEVSKDIVVRSYIKYELIHCYMLNVRAIIKYVDVYDKRNAKSIITNMQVVDLAVETYGYSANEILWTKRSQ